MDVEGAFFWGAASSAYQVEGSFDADGKGLSVWDVFCQRAGSIRGGASGERACDHYRRIGADVKLMAEIGLGAYRFSVSWPRVIPSGVGKPNAKGLDFYSRLVDGLLGCGIEPFVTLFHWDFPFALYRQGGWLNPDASKWFAAYAAAVADELSDRVRFWITINEPQSFIIDGHLTGVQAPGDRMSTAAAAQAAHHVLCAHGRAVQALRDRSRRECRIGYAPVGMVGIPASEGEADVEAARRWMFSMPGRDLWVNTWWMDPVYGAGYPEDGRRAMGADCPAVADGDHKLISRPLDFFAFNTYLGRYVRADGGGQPEVIEPKPGHPRATTGNPLTPACLYWGPLFFHRRYGLPILVSENGMANADWVAEDGRVHDPQRSDFLRRHIRHLRAAVGDGVPVIGYMYWSVMDDFEWENGYEQRYGLIHVDFQSQKRTAKDSAACYRDLMQT